MVFVEFFEFYTYPSRFRRRPVTSRECPPSSFLALLEAILVDAYLQQFCQNVEVGFEDSALDNTLAGIDQRVKRRLISSELLSSRSLVEGSVVPVKRHWMQFSKQLDPGRALFNATGL